MSEDFEIKGADEFKKLARSLESVDLRKDLQKGIREAVRKHVPVAAEALAAALPQRLKPRGQKVVQTVSVNASRDPGVTVGMKYGASSKKGLGAQNALLVNKSGQIRHRVFGREQWVSQHVGGQGWFDKSWQASAPNVQREIEKVLEQVADNVIRDARR